MVFWEGKGRKSLNVIDFLKAEELGKFIKENNIDVVFLNAELTAIQTRNLETYFDEILG